MYGAILAAYDKRIGPMNKSTVTDAGALLKLLWPELDVGRKEAFLPMRALEIEAALLADLTASGTAGFDRYDFEALLDVALDSKSPQVRVSPDHRGFFIQMIAATVPDSGIDLENVLLRLLIFLRLEPMVRSRKRRITVQIESTKKFTKQYHRKFKVKVTPYDMRQTIDGTELSTYFAKAR